MVGSHGHGHSHAPVPLAGSPAGEDEGLRAVKLSAAGLGLTAAVQFVFVAASGSVALLADGLHNLGDVFAGMLVVLAIAVSAVVAAAESLARLSGEVPPLRNPGWALAAAFAGVAGLAAAAGIAGAWAGWRPPTRWPDCCCRP